MPSAWNDKRWARLLSRLLLLALLAYGGFLRYHDLGVSLYDDEINTRERAMQTIGYTLETRAYPLYYLAAKATLQLSDTESALRLPSFIAGLLSILAIYGLVRQLHSRTAGLVAAALLAFNPFHITHSDFARYYALLMFFTILTVWMLYRALERGRWHQWLAYTVSAFLALSSHICFAPALAALNVGAAFYLLFNREKGPLEQRIALVALLACCTVLSTSFILYKKADSVGLFSPAFVAQAAEVTGSTAPGESPEADWDGPSLLKAHQQHTRGGGAVFTNPNTGEVRYRLTYYDCLEYLKRYFWSDTVWVWPLLIVIGVWGLLDLIYRVPATGIPLLTGFFLAPAGLFFYNANHWYHPRYLSYAFIFALIMVSIGFCVVPRFLSRVLGSPRSLRLWRRVPDARLKRNFSIANILYVILVGALAVPAVPIINESYQTYPVSGYLPRGPLQANHSPERDWRNLYKFAAHTVKEGDQFLFMSPDNEHGPRYARYYFSKFMPWAEEENHFVYRFGVPTAQGLKAFAERRPMANLWCVGYLKYDAQHQAKFLRAAGASQINFWERNRINGLTLFCVGAPTTNHVANGSFEKKMRKDLPEGVQWVTDTAYGGYASLKIECAPSDVAGQEHWSRYAMLPVGPADYRLRNNGFEAWKNNRPVGWTTHVNAPTLLTPIRPGFEGGTSLRLGPSDDKIVLQQSIPMGLAPGRRVEIQMMGKSDIPNNLHLVLRYQGPGYQKEQHTVHPGTGKWIRMNMIAEVPADADPDSITAEVWRMPGGNTDAVVDNVEVRVREIGGRLEPGEPHVLSLALRTENVRDRRGSDQRPAGYVRLRWEDSQGKVGHQNLIEIHQEEGWRYRTASFTPGVDIPLDITSLRVEVGLEDGTGTLWVDQVQVEEGTAPTPFTDTFRLPHDEMLATKDLSQYEVPANWK